VSHHIYFDNLAMMAQLGAHPNAAVIRSADEAIEKVTPAQHGEQRGGGRAGQRMTLSGRRGEDPTSAQ